MRSQSRSVDSIQSPVVFIVLDHGQVVYESTSELNARVFMTNAGRGVLCQVLEVCCTEFLHGKNGNRKTA